MADRKSQKGTDQIGGVWRSLLDIFAICDLPFAIPQLAEPASTRTRQL